MMMTPTVSPADKEGDRHSWAMLQRARPAVEWDKSSLRRADMTGDGQRARVMIGKDDDGQYWVGVVRPDGREGPDNPMLVGVGQPALLSLSFHKLESADDCRAGGDTPLEGCRPRKGQRGLSITVSRTTPPQRLYWHTTLRRFTVWAP